MKKFKITINNKIYNIEIENIVNDYAFIKVNGISYEVEIERIKERGAGGIESMTETPTPSQRKIGTEEKSSASLMDNNRKWKITAPLSGLILDLLIKEGDRVKAGETVLRMEAMKMENDILSPRDGIIRKIMVTKGMEVREGEVLAEFGN